jgi:hypothetical protein
LPETIEEKPKKQKSAQKSASKKTKSAIKPSTLMAAEQEARRSSWNRPKSA